MAGHSKWANIKHRKERSDKQKGKMFSRLAKEIISAVKQGGADPKGNPRLRLAIQKAKIANFPNDNIERNIKKATSGEQENYEVVTYEIYGYGGVGLLVMVLTDNKNRASSDMRIAINKKGGTIANPGSVAFNFDRKGIIQIARKEQDATKLFEGVIEAGAEDFEVTDEGFVVITEPTALYAVKEKLDAQGWTSEEADIQMIPKALIGCNAQERSCNLALIEWIEDLDDVDAVYHNMEIS
jgi:YebC/PmpR family DNA-binding regulatory protein